MTLTVFPGCLPAPWLVGVLTLGLPHRVAPLLLLGLLSTNTATTVSHVAALVHHPTAPAVHAGVVAIPSSSSGVVAASSSKSGVVAIHWHWSWQDLRAHGATRVEAATSSSSTGASSASSTPRAGHHRDHGSHDGT